MSERRTIRQVIAGKKTVIGVWICLLSGIVNVASIWIYIDPKIPTSMFMCGFAIGLYGIYSRIMFVFYPAPKGKPNTNRPKLKAPRVGG